MKRPIFWQKWRNANEIERQRLVETLPIMDLMAIRNGSMLNSYFEDLEDFLNDEFRHEMKEMMKIGK